jgi:hypothetical protein
MFEMAQIYTPSSKITAEIAKKLGKSKEDVTDLSDDDLREIAALANNALEQRAEETSVPPSASPLSPNTESASVLGEEEAE